jgi:DNA polymerase I-like protein with 3'-5' exonuclease and polymerase domains
MTTLYLDIEAAEGILYTAGYAVDDGPVQHFYRDDKDGRKVADLLRDPDVVKVAHSTFDWTHFLSRDYEVDGPLHNTMVMAWRLDENQPLDLATLTQKYRLSRTKHKMLVRRNKVIHFKYKGQLYPLTSYTAWPQPVRIAFDSYNANDVTTLRLLYKALLAELRTRGLEDYWLREDVPYTTTLLRMEQRGMPIDLEAAAELTSRLEMDLAEAKRHLLESAQLPPVFNLDSPTQLAKFLFSKRFAIKGRVEKDEGIVYGLSGKAEQTFKQPYGFVVEKVGRTWVHGAWMCNGLSLSPTPPKKNPKTGVSGKQPSTAATDLLYYHAGVPWIQEYCLHYKKLSKLLGTYLRQYPKIARDGRIYGHFNQTGTVTGRLSSSNPNLQNQPSRGELGKAVRSLFTGRLVVGDYDQLEMRIMAHYSQDPNLLKIFRTGADPHAITAQAIFGRNIDEGQRDVGKTVNYALGYGAGPRKLAHVLSLGGYPTTWDTAIEYIKETQDFYARLYEWRDEVIEQAKEQGHIKTLGGRVRHLQGSFSTTRWTKGDYGSRQAVNAKIQGSAADILQRVMMRTDWNDLWLICQVHDELVWEWERRPSRETLASLQAIAEAGHGYRLTLPLSFSPHVVSSWAGKAGHIEGGLVDEDD